MLLDSRDGWLGFMSGKKGALLRKMTNSSEKIFLSLNSCISPFHYHPLTGQPFVLFLFISRII